MQGSNRSTTLAQPAPVPAHWTLQGTTASAPSSWHSYGRVSAPHPTPNLPCDTRLSPAKAAGSHAGCRRRDSDPICGGKVPVPSPSTQRFHMELARVGMGNMGSIQFILSSCGTKRNHSAFSTPSNQEPGSHLWARPSRSPLADLLPGRHSCSLWFYIKQTLPASSPAGPGNRAADLGQLGTVLPSYLDFEAKSSICKILHKPWLGGQWEVGASPARCSSLPSQQLSITLTAPNQSPSPPLDAPAHEAFL